MARDATATRERLLDAATKIFASQGVEQANLRDINRAAGQSNNSALHYHFGSREELLSAVLRRHRATIDDLRRELLATATRAGSAPSLEQLLTINIRPLCSLLESEGGRDYLRVLAHLRRRSEMRAQQNLNPASSADLRDVYDRLAAGLSHLPDRVRAERLAVWIDMSLVGLAGRAEDIEAGLTPLLDAEEFLINLVDMGAAALAAPSRLRDS